MSKPKKKVDAKKKAAEQKLRNEERRLKYSKDVDYRQRKRAESRNSYREVNGFNAKNIANDDLMKKIGSVRTVKLSRVYKKVLCFSTSELSNALNLSPLTMYRMQGDNRIPKPHFSVKPGESSTVLERVYLWPEVKVIAGVLKAHHSEFIHYRKTHTETMAQIHSALHKVRSAYKNG